MVYRIFLIVILIMFTAPGTAGEKRYRVEILVLSHLQHEAVPSDAERLRDFSSSLDFLKAEDSEDEDGEETQDDEVGAELLMVNSEADEPGGTVTAPGQETGSELLPDEDQPEEPWADVIVVESMSDVMREAWRRLRLSAPFRPEQYLSWEQSADEPFPSLRIHDLDVLLIDSPCVDLPETSTVEAEEMDGPFVFTDQGSILPGDAIEEAPEEPDLPDPTLLYRIDGTVMLRRSRFLHLDLDLELRHEVFDERLLTTHSRGQVSEPDPLQADSGEQELPLSPSFLIHSLKQSRQVKSLRMEYFDSPVLGVLAWITPFEAEDEAENLPE